MSYEPFDILYVDLIDLARTGYTDETRDATVSGYLLTYNESNDRDYPITESGIEAWIDNNWDAVERSAYGTYATTYLDYAHYEHREDYNVPGGEQIGDDDWIARELNTTVSEYGDNISRNGNTVTIEEGVYTCRAMVDSAYTGNFKGRVFDVTNSGTLLIGDRGDGAGGTYAQAEGLRSTLDGIITISGTTDIQLQMSKVSTTAQFEDQQLGRAAQVYGEEEIYARLVLVRLR